MHFVIAFNSYNNVSNDFSNVPGTRPLVEHKAVRVRAEGPLIQQIEMVPDKCIPFRNLRRNITLMSSIC